MRPAENMIVNIEGSLDPDHREITWLFQTFDPDTGEPPDLAGFLPPIDTLTWNEIGWVDFEIDALPGLSTGTEITNQCFVNFDSIGPWNPAPKDRPWVNTIDAGAPESQVNALPDTSHSTFFEVSWDGADDSLGSGIRSYTIYYSIDGGIYEIWLEDTTSTEETFYGEHGHTYAFYSISTDNVGHEEEFPFSPDAEVMVYLTYFCGDANSDETVNVADAVWIINYVFAGGDPPDPMESCDCNCDSDCNVVDAVWLINYIFIGGDEPCANCPQKGIEMRVIQVESMNPKIQKAKMEVK